MDNLSSGWQEDDIVSAQRGGFTIWLLALAMIPLFPSSNSASAEELQEQALSSDSLIVLAREIIDASRVCALITMDESGWPRARAMDAFSPEEDMTIWLGTNRNTRKVQDIGRDPRVALYYYHPDGVGYVSIYGKARLVDDAKEKAHRWKEEWARYYPNRDATYLLIAVTPERLELTHYGKGIIGDPQTWCPPSVRFDNPGSHD